MTAISRYLKVLVLSVFLGTVSGIAGAQLTFVPSDDTFLFANRPGKIEVTLRNDASDDRKARVDYRIYQATSATLAPVGKRESLGDRQFPAEQGATISIPFAPPNVRAITLFVVKIYLGDDEMGSVRATVLPPNIFSRLLDDGVTHVRLHEPYNFLRAILEEDGVKVAEGNMAEAKLAIVRLPNATAEAAWQNEGENSSAPTLFIVGRGVTGAEKLLPTKFRQTDRGTRIAIVQDWFVPDLEENALSQLRLLRAMEFLIKPRRELDPGSKEKKD
jgi:hypothetical protein